MSETNRSSFALAAALGAIAGMRSFSAPAVISHAYSTHPSANLDHPPFKFIQAVNSARVFKVLAAGELIGDKLPGTPNRTDAPALTARILSGAFAGATVCKAKGSNIVAGGLIGAAAALVSTFGCFYLRTSATKNTSVPDAAIAVLEDALVIGAAVAIAKQL